MGKRAWLRASTGALFCALALAIAYSAAVSAETTGKTTNPRQRAEATSDIVVTEAHIVVFKYALNLRPEQEPYWAPVEAALRDLAQRPASAPAERTSFRSTGSGLNSRFKRLSAAAIPLIKTFDESQKRNLQMLSRTFGFEHWLALH